MRGQRAQWTSHGSWGHGPKVLPGWAVGAKRGGPRPAGWQEGGARPSRPAWKVSRPSPARVGTCFKGSLC